MSRDMKRTVDPIQSNISKGDAEGNRANYVSALNFYLEAAQNIVSLNWHLPVCQKIRSIFLGDINNDGKDELLFGTEGHFLVAYQAKIKSGEKEPKKLWEFKTNDWVTGIATADLNEDGIEEIIVASDKLYILSCDGKYIKEQPSDLSISALQTYSDSGCQMIVVGNSQGEIHCLDFQLSEIWTLPFKTKGRVIDIAIGDFDGDGRIEIAAASEDKYVYIINDRGEEKDRINVRHWIVNLADCKMINSQLRLFIGKFTGDTLVYKHKQTSQLVKLKQSGILDLKVDYLLDKTTFPQFVVGSSDRCLSIFDYSGELIWAFESGLGQRAISIKKNKTGKFEMYVGTESGDLFSYTIDVVKDLAQKIKNAYNNSGTQDLLDLKIDPNKLKILRNYIDYNPIKRTASPTSINKANNFQDAVISAMEVWFNNCGFAWKYETQGRIYDVAYASLCQDKVLLVGSDDGGLYCLNQDGKEIWNFLSQKDLKGVSQGIRGVFTLNESVFTASVDKSLYKLNHHGIPEWNFRHEDWVLYTSAGSFCDSNIIQVFAGTEDGFVLAFDSDGCLVWKNKLKERIRALAFCPGTQGEAFLVAGCDDNKVYIIDQYGKTRNSFSTPHYVLVVKVYDIDDDGKFEILTGNENGHLHVYDFEGKLLWRFVTESWVAALDIFKNNESGETEIAVGSQDNHVYVLNKYGALLWQYEANARVRTISADCESKRLAFGSYDCNAYVLEQVNRNETREVLNGIYKKYEVNKKIQQLFDSESRYLRAFAYLFTTDCSTLIRGLTDTSDIVIAAIGTNLVENFLPKDKYEDDLVELIVNASRQVKSVVLCRLAELMKGGKIKKRIVARILSGSIIKAKLTTEKIDIFRYWLTMTENCDDILRLTECLVPHETVTIDELLLDEINRACHVAISKNTDDSGDYTIIEKAKRIAKLIEAKYPDTANLLLKAF